jgi:putative hydrolase of the HAD superfamily
MLHRRPRAVFLDAGNTLVQLDYGVLAAVAGGGRAPVSPDVIRRAEWAARVRLDALLAHVADAHAAVVASASAPAAALPSGPSTESPSTFRLFMTMIFEEAGLGLAGAALARVLDEVEDYHQAHNLWSRPHPFAARVLEDLKRLGVKLAVVSNSGGDLDPLLERLGLRRALDAVVDSGVIGVEKPEPRIFLVAAERLGVAPAEAVHVGDLYGIDVVGARGAGVEPVLIDPGSLWPQTDCVKIRDLTAMPELVRRARSAA